MNKNSVELSSMEYSIALRENQGTSSTYTGWEAIKPSNRTNIMDTNCTNLYRCMAKNGTILDYVSPNQFGGLAYLWSTEPTVSPNTGPTYGLYDAMTGTKILTFVNCSAAGSTSSVVTSLSVQFANGPNGEILGYWLNSQATTLSMWNSSLAVIKYSNLTGTGNWQWRPPQRLQIPWSTGVQWTVSLANNKNTSERNHSQHGCTESQQT